VLAAGELETGGLPQRMTTVRHAMTTLRYRWFDVRIGGPAATMRGQWRVLVVAVVAIFACFFAIGRLSSPSRAVQASATATEAPSSHPAIPSGLSGGPTATGSVPAAIVPRPRPKPRVTARPGQAAPTPVVVTSFPAQASTPAAPSVSQQVAPTSAPTPAQAEATKPAAPTSSGGASEHSGGSASSSAPSGNGSFDSSE
jgi:hypothetical protein